jgi:hypothetical protein
MLATMRSEEGANGQAQHGSSPAVIPPPADEQAYSENGVSGILG